MSTEIPICNRCRQAVHPGRGDHYLVGIIAVADPTPPIITEDDLARDLDAEIRHLIGQMGQTDEQAAIDQVYRRKVMRLCNACYRGWIEDPTAP